MTDLFGLPSRLWSYVLDGVDARAREALSVEPFTYSEPDENGLRQRVRKAS